MAYLLGADRIGITVGEETFYQYQPEQTTSAIISSPSGGVFRRPQAQGGPRC